MEELERLKRKIKNARDLQSVVKIMKTISASNIREYEQAVESLSEYNKTIEMGFQIVMRNKPKELLTVKPVEKKRRLGAVIFGSDQGLCGSFNEQIAGYAIEKMNEIENQERIALAVGERVVSRLEEAGQPTEAHSFYGDHLGITQVMLDVLVKIEEWRIERKIDQIVLFYNRSVSGAAYGPNMVQLFPLDLQWLNSLAEKKWPSCTLPTFSMDVDQLFSSLVRQYLFFTLYCAFVESLASENASRLLSMQAAEKNIEEHLNDLNAQFHRQRQAAITSELLDVVTGFEALTEDR
ncbi:MAG: F0F1 ATP synthase subunit gamma [Methanotrichaceae archaeon]|jgi:F-type H+-transporting ATPase subunit gamma